MRQYYSLFKPFVLYRLVLGSLILYLKGRRILMLQLSGFYSKGLEASGVATNGL